MASQSNLFRYFEKQSDKDKEKISNEKRMILVKGKEVLLKRTHQHLKRIYLRLLLMKSEKNSINGWFMTMT